MLTGKELTINELVDNMNELKKQIYSIATQIEINIANIQLKAITPKDIMVKGGKISDRMTNFVIKDESLRFELESKKESYNDYRKKVIAKISEIDDAEDRIIFFRDKLHWKWSDIAKVENYSERQVRRKYKIAKNKI